MTCASTRGRSDFKERCEAGLFTCVCLPHAEDVAILAARGVADHHSAAFKQTVANDSAFSIVQAVIVDFDSHPREDLSCVFEVQASFCESLLAFDWVVGDPHAVIVSTTTARGKLGARPWCLRRLTQS